MSISRRKFLQVGTVAALAAGIPLKTTLVANGQGMRKGSDGNPGDRLPTDITDEPLSYYTKAAFSAYLNSTFFLRTESLGAVAMTLTEVKDMTGATNEPGRECFSLRFESREKGPTSQHIYGLEHDALGSFSLFLVPGGVDEKRRRNYVAVINRLPNSPALITSPNRSSKRSGTLRREDVTPTRNVTPKPALPPDHRGSSCPAR